MPFKVFRAESSTHARRPILMLLHGMGLTIATFRGIIPHLLPTHDLILPDYAGFHADAELPREASLKAFSAGVWRIADALGISQLSLAGNSLGGGLCLMAALAQPRRVERMCLSNPACYPQDLPGMYNLVRWPLLGELFMLITGADKFVGGVEYIGYVDKSRFDPVLRRIYIEALSIRRNRERLMSIIRQLPAGPCDLACATHIGRLGELNMPTLLSWGKQDPLLVTDAGDRLAHALPRVTYDIHPDLAHMPHEETPDRIGPRWAEFLNEARVLQQVPAAAL